MKDDREFIGLWAGGKRPLIIPQGKGAVVIDLSAVLPVLTDLLYGVRDPDGMKGNVFEEAARQTWRDAGLEIVHQGDLDFHDGTKREADAIIRDGNRLIQIECVAIERPVDWEWSKPGKTSDRRTRLADKVEQAKSLNEKLRSVPTGKNFDFSWAELFDWRVCPVFTEFAMTLNDDEIDPAGVPRILRPDELARWLPENEQPAPIVSSYISRARSEMNTKTSEAL